MARTPFRPGKAGVTAALAVAAVLLLSMQAGAAPPLVDAPVVWYDRDDADIRKPAERDPNLLWDGVETTVVRPVSRLFRPGRLLRRAGGVLGADLVAPARNVNCLDEVPNSSWFTNRIGLYPLTPDEAANGPCTVGPPSRDGEWVIVRAKTEGVTPGFNIRDARGETYVVKFDPPRYPGMTTAAGIISNRILHAAGYNVPEDGMVRFRREKLVLGEGVKISGEDGTKRPMTEEDMDMILARIDRMPDGVYLAATSRFLGGEPLGPFDYHGRRKDDGNDRIDHQHRRELRGLGVIAAWLNHFDTKQHNSLDMYVEEDGRRFVRHYLIDFASTIGTGARGPTPLHGFENGFDFTAVGRRIATAGLYEDDWRRLVRPARLAEVGYWESELFDPRRWKPLTPNSAFANVTDRDGYWAAKIVTAFNDEHLAAIVGEAGYDDPEAGRYVRRILAERRDEIGRYWFERVAPLVFFRVRDRVVTFRDLGEERGIFEAGAARYRARLAMVDADRSVHTRSRWSEIGGTRIDLDGEPFAALLAGADPAGAAFLSIELSVNRGEGWTGGPKVYIARESGRVVAVER